MQAFGITFDRFSTPIVYLACSIVGFLLIRESVHMLHYPIATRAISVILEIGFILLCLPAINSLKCTSISRKAVYLLGFWLLWTLTSTLLGSHPWAGMVRWFELLSSIATALCIWLLIRERPKLAKYLVFGIISALLFCLFVFLVYWLLLPSPAQHNWVTDIPLFVNIRHFGYLPAAALPLGYWLLEQSQSYERTTLNTSKYLTKRNVISLYLTLCWGLVFWLGGRGAFLSVTIVTAIYFFLSNTNIKLSIYSIFLGLALSQLFIVDVTNLNLLRFLDLFLNGADKDLNTLSSSRIAIYQESILYWWNNAPLFGLGADGYRYIIPAIFGVEAFFHPHNSIIQLLISFSFPGILIPFCLFILFTLRIVSRGNKIHMIFFLSLISSLLLSLIDGVLYHAYGLFISTVLIGIGLSYAWPKSTNAELAKQKNNNQYSLNALILLTAISTSLYYSVFIHQVYQSKYGCVDKHWINWNARYPIYFSPTWNYERYSLDDIEQLKSAYLENKKNITCFE